ncbi:MAG: hypothetical protein ACYCU5_05890 [Actinomycetes bacterium]
MHAVRRSSTLAFHDQTPDRQRTAYEILVPTLGGTVRRLEIARSIIHMPVVAIGGFSTTE